MTSSKLMVLVNYSFVMAIGYILIWYTFNPTTDRCLMSFMMEPPTFIDMSVNFVPELSSEHDRKPYKLYLYSEFDFPARKKDGFDLKDSFPVVFIPGNAGSYQQVRSLASTCTRKQIESLNAYRFVFYTIDFGGQLSGLNGDLVEHQTSYVKLCLDRIKTIQPDKFNGVIIVGHSVGGFIAKSLFTLPGFDPDSVPLMISLSSPLVKPYVSFDYKMRELYNKTNEYWQQYGFDQTRATTAISIGGGKSDRLVPTQLTMDPHFDLSLTTASTKDVWFSTDHNGITWCREIMYKLANTLSAVMDKQNNRLVAKPKLLDIMKSKLLTRKDPPSFLPHIITRESNLTKQFNIVDFNGFHQILRSQFSDLAHIVDISKNQNSDLMIIIDHNHVIKPNGVFGCQDVRQTKTGQTSCLIKTNLLDYASAIPSSFYEPQRTIVKLSRNNTLDQLAYVALDFSSSERTVPESVVMLAVDLNASESLYLPPLTEYLVRTLLRYPKIIKNIHFPFNSYLLYRRFVIRNQKFRTQYYSIRFEAHSCRQDTQPGARVVTKSSMGYIVEGFTSDARSGDRSSVTVDIGPKSNMIVNNKEMIDSDDTVLDAYLDGNCQHKVILELDLLSMIANMIKTKLDFILTCTTYIGSLRTLDSHFKIINKSNSAFFMASSGLFIIYQNQLPILVNSKFEPKSELIIECTLLFGIAYGLTILLGFILDRLIDVAIIVNRIPLYWIMKTPEGQESQNSINPSVEQRRRNNVNLTLCVLITATSVVLSTAMTSLLAILLLIKSGLFIDEQRKKYRFSPDKTLRIDDTHSLLLDLGSLVGLALLANIPAGLIRVKSGREMLMSLHVGHEYLVNLSSGLTCLLLTRFVCSNVESYLTNTKQSIKPSEISSISKFKSMLKIQMPSTSFHIIVLLITLTVNVNLCHINYVLLATLIIINCVQ